MTRFTSWRAGAVVVATGLLVAACSGGSGGSGGGGTSSNGSLSIGAPTGISGNSASAHGSKTASKGATSSASHKPGHGASTTGGRATSTSTHHSGGGGGGHSSSPATQHSSSTPIDNGCRSSAPPKASDPSKASITVCPAIGLHTGDIVTITGHSFKANESLIVTECHYLGENANNYALSQCNIGNILNFKPSKTTKSDASGNVGPVTLAVAEQFKRIDCSSEPCLISVAVPIQNSAADNPHVIIKFS